ncbi:hypothetical protein ACMXYV_00440 [Neptuniibacter sp. SY11_33]|uniref:hypothetical protein n=1 Tax=Neptuniibacter sp. SY11_33 TaxID=3398215 RepID=UPI0039F53ADC
MSSNANIEIPSELHQLDSFLKHLDRDFVLWIREIEEHLYVLENIKVPWSDELIFLNDQLRKVTPIFSNNSRITEDSLEHLYLFQDACTEFRQKSITEINQKNFSEEAESLLQVISSKAKKVSTEIARVRNIVEGRINKTSILEWGRRVGELESTVSEINILIEALKASEKLPSVKDIQQASIDVRSASERHTRIIEEEADEAIDKINKLAGSVAQNKAVGNYESAAGKEKLQANWWRAGALALMFISAYILASSVFDLPFASSLSKVTSISPDGTKIESYEFNQYEIGLKLLLSILLTAPAVFCGRESAKHRVKQNAYEQIAMNVGTANILSKQLGPESHDEIIKEMAKRLFASPVGVDAKGVAADPVPLNTNELLLKVVDKLDFKPSKETDKTSEKAK